MVYFIFAFVKMRTTFPIEFFATITGYVGPIWMLAHLRRSNVEFATRLFLAANLLLVLALCAVSSFFATQTAVRIVILVLIVG